MTDTISLLAGLQDGRRRSLARAITLVESTRRDHLEAAADLLDRLPPTPATSLRLGVTGPPGAGKSTLLDVLGLRLVEAGHRVAVLAIDPASQTGAGSILGDKTRMAALSTSTDAFIRPSPGSADAGGTARTTAESIRLCEAAGHDVVIVETIGVGQSETTVAGMVDLMLLLAPPGAGDDLQGIKRGVMELADVVAVTKHDGDLAADARRTASDYEAALHLTRRRRAPVVPVSALTGHGVDDLLDAIAAEIEDHRGTGAFDARRRAQRVAEFERWVERDLRRRAFTDGDAERRLADLREAVATDRRAARAAGMEAGALVARA